MTNNNPLLEINNYGQSVWMDNLSRSLKELDLSLGNCTAERFPDGEISIRLTESVGETSFYPTAYFPSCRY